MADKITYSGVDRVHRHLVPCSDTVLALPYTSDAALRVGPRGVYKIVLGCATY